MFHVVLYEPEIPPNTGNVIRLCANAGAILHLVKPLGFKLDDKGLQRGGLDYHDLAEVRVHPDLDACLNDLQGMRVFAVETDGHIRYSDFKPRAGDAFLFGPETRGLPAAVRDRIGRENSLFLPMRPKCRSINLSNTVAIVVFDAWRQTGFAGLGSQDSFALRR
jgi:tRNA (cytidine/uridine-2'-O-)-methyltransferase